ncbi:MULTISPECIES: YARHG domain-containing protein [unclassified Flavobacterium]|uniref:YARHG domain-containing protein n=1 Tax=unclassified Flavobacterium TaxID=196869 RepID=UPI001290B891|nr:MULTISPECIES: YARHG domain-containing protein [unclassified Flavobacterium]MQP53395.1 YARHG domain-containing protein [Flavobacterium sp. LMO9]MQP63441.1 YARHG domain-containing protein [Flavobacterium sp. LMO6]
MKLFYSLICVSFFTISCKEAIKNDVKFVAEQSFEEIQFVEPKVSNSLVVNSKADLLGYWVGDFKADISEEKTDSIYQEKNYNLLNRKITFSIDEIKGDSIFGHSITAGNISLFKGIVFQNESKFVIKADEFKQSKYDGLFVMNISKNDSLLIGNWLAYNPKELKVATRKYQLQKKIFKYNPNNKVDEIFINDDKFNVLKYNDTIDGEEVENEFEEYFTNTEKLYEKNASIDELTSDFVSNLSKADIFILRNSIFARHGFAFRDKQLRMYFELFDWYMPVFGDVKEDLTEIEIKNIDLLLRYEQNAEEYYDTFGR